MDDQQPCGRKPLQSDGLGADAVTGTGIAAQIHDIGKVGVPAELLTLHGPFCTAEFELIKESSRAGRQVIASISFPWPVAEMVYEHRERFDGSGYPGGLKGDEISMSARIIAITDVLEALASYRPYRPALGLGAAMIRLEEDRCLQFDPGIVDTCLDLFRTAQLKLEL